MDPLSALLVVAGIVAVATFLGLLWRARDGRRRSGDDTRLSAADLGLDHDAAFGDRATLLQFSTGICSRCPGTRRLLRSIADSRDGVVHAEVDLTDRADLASRFRILQTPTTLVLDPKGRLRTRFGGVPRRDEVIRALDALIAS